MIHLLGLILAGLWLLVGGVIGQRYYRRLRDQDGLRPWPALARAIGWGIVRPPWLIGIGVWSIVSGGLTPKKK